ncbi:MAG: TetR/AcrR family transcriptional regulator [Acidimicrobiia bacterium]|nr:TetR/AcrR family transcriptional regulator [Acidimicrobiia bacterium]
MAPTSTATLDSEPRRRLIAAAEARFRRFGYRRTTVEDITAEAETGKGSLYLHFDSKQDVYLAVVSESLERFVRRASEVLEGHDSVPLRLAALVEATAHHYGEDELLRASLLGHGELVEGRVAELAAEIQRDRIRSLLAMVLLEGQEAETIRGDLDAETTASVLFEMGWAIVRAELEGHSDLPLELALRTLNDVVGRGVLA